MVFFINSVNLDDVTTATVGQGVNMREYERKSVFIDVSVNTGAVTVNIEASYNGVTWFNLNSTTYSATTTQDVRSYSSHFPYMRTTTTSQTNATVKTILTGKE